MEFKCSFTFLDRMAKQRIKIETHGIEIETGLPP